MTGRKSVFSGDSARVGRVTGNGNGNGEVTRESEDGIAVACVQ